MSRSDTVGDCPQMCDTYPGQAFSHRRGAEGAESNVFLVFTLRSPRLGGEIWVTPVDTSLPRAILPLAGPPMLDA